MRIVFPSLMEMLLLLLLIWVVVRIVSGGRRRPPSRNRPPPGPPRPVPPPRGGPRRPQYPRPPRPTVNVPQFALAVLFSFILLPIWALASIGDLIAIPIHLAMATITSALALMLSLIGTAPRRMWGVAGRQFARAGRSSLSILNRLLATYGCAGLVEKMRDDIREETQRVASSVSRTAEKSYPFEDGYRIESKLGSGGSTARLFVVRRLDRNRPDGVRPIGDRMVLKYFDLGRGSRLEEVIRESRGMQVAKEMGIVLDHRLEKDHFYYVMPYYAGETLTRAAARVHRHLRADEAPGEAATRQFLRWTSEILRTLDGYHRHGVIHKDVKPDNVIVTDDGTRLVDLGLLTPVASAMTLTTHGTEYFRDPEMVKQAVAGKRVKDVEAVRFDVYSAGAVLYYLFEGSFPSCGPLSRFSRPVPMALSWIVSRAMAEGDKRYPRIAAMRADLEEALRLAESGELADAPVSRLPSFRGFEGIDLVEPPPPPMPGGSAIPVLSPVAPARPPAAPRRRRSMLAGPAIALLTAVLTAALLFAFLLTGGRALGPERSGTALRDASARSIRELTPDFAVERIQEWQRDLGSRLSRAGEKVDLTKIPVLLLADRTFERSVKDAAYRKGSSIVFEPSGERTDAIRDFVYPGISPVHLQDKLLEVYGEDTLPVFFWIRSDRDGRSSKIVGYYRGYSFEKDVEGAFPSVASWEPNR